MLRSASRPLKVTTDGSKSIIRRPPLGQLRAVIFLVQRQPRHLTLAHRGPGAHERGLTEPGGSGGEGLVAMQTLPSYQDSVRTHTHPRRQRLFLLDGELRNLARTIMQAVRHEM